MKQIIINADDFGQTEACTLAIWEAFQNHFITDTTMVANGEAYNLALNLIQEHPEIQKRIGVHFILTEGRPLSEPILSCPRLVKNGEFTSYFRNNKTYFVPLTKQEKKAIYCELTAQIQRLKQSGIQISHADSHHHVHLNWQIAPIFVKVCNENEITKVRINYNVVKEDVFRQTIYSAYNRWIRRKGFCTTDFFENITKYSQIPDGTSEIMVHPDYNNKNELINRIKKIKDENGCRNVGELLQKDLQQKLSGKEHVISYKEFF